MDKVTLREAPLSFDSGLQQSSEERGKDTLNLLPYASALNEFIHGCETPMTIGIMGDWGTGKTSLMNMLRGNGVHDKSGLLMSTRCKVVSFETWSYAQFNQDDHLALSCLYALTKLVSQKLSNLKSKDAAVSEKLNAAKSRIGNILKNVNVSVAGVSVGLGDAADDAPTFDFTDIAEQMILFRREFEELINLWVADDDKKRVVIFVDDLDRIKPIRAIELLEAIKNFADVPGCVFVFAVDYEVIQSGVVEKLGKDIQKTSGKSFFDKIIQLPFMMPTSSYKLDGYIMGLLRKAEFPYIKQLAGDKNSVQFFHDITVCTVGRNPRSIKRVMNFANLLEKIRKKHSDKGTSMLDSKILYALICMQIAWPELFAYFAKNPTAETITNFENWDFLDELPEARSVLERAHDEDMLKDDISMFLDCLMVVLDTDDDGRVSAAEMEPVLKVMRLTKMTSIDAKQRPRDYIVERISANNKPVNSDIKWFLDVYRKSMWFVGSTVQYRKAGSRYISIVRERKQVGSIVSLKKTPFVFRLSRKTTDLRDQVKSNDLLMSLSERVVDIARPANDDELPLTGFGDTIIDHKVLKELGDNDAVAYMNALHDIIYKTT